MSKTHPHRLTAAVRAFASWPFNDEEIAVAEETGYAEALTEFFASVQQPA